MSEIKASSIVVIDCGTSAWRVGFANNVTPPLTFQPISKDIEKSGIISNGMVTEFTIDQKVISYFSKHIKESLALLKVNGQECDLLLSVPQKLSHIYRERLTEMIFESLGFQSLFYVSQPLLAAYSSGYSNCLIVDSGYSHTGILAVKEFNPLQDSERVLPLGGMHVDKFLHRIAQNELSSYSNADLLHLKQQYCSVSQGGITPSGSNSKQETIVMPDGKRLLLPSNLLQLAPEMLFNPSIGDLPDVMPIDQAAIRSSLVLEDNDSYAVLENVILTGGNTMFRGCGERMKLGIATRTLPRINKRVVHHKFGAIAVWTGGACIASTNTYEKICITKALYKESGAKIVTSRWL